jgi:DNA primase
MNVIYYEPKYQINSFKATVEVAYNLKDLLDMLDIKSYVKTGKTGLHIFVYLSLSSHIFLQRRYFRIDEIHICSGFLTFFFFLLFLFAKFP